MERRRSWRSTAASHHSVPLPPGRNSPLDDPAGCREPRQHRGDDRGAETEVRRGVGGVERAVGAGVARDQVAHAGRRPVRGTRRAARPAGRCRGRRAAARRPRSRRRGPARRPVPRSRRRDPPAAATTPGVRRGRPRPARSRRAEQPQQVGGALRVAGVALAVRAAAARPRPAATASASSSSRSSACPSSSASRPVSSASAAARRSASGESPSYRNCAT